MSGSQDAILAELDKIGASSDVDSQLAQLKGELAANAPLQIEGNVNGNGNGSVNGHSAGAAGQEAGAAEQAGDES